MKDLGCHVRAGSEREVTGPTSPCTCCSRCLVRASWRHRCVVRSSRPPVLADKITGRLACLAMGWMMRTRLFDDNHADDSSEAFVLQFGVMITHRTHTRSLSFCLTSFLRTHRSRAQCPPNHKVGSSSRMTTEGGRQTKSLPACPHSLGSHVMRSDPISGANVFISPRDSIIVVFFM